jgi:hypothetical protein
MRSLKIPETRENYRNYLELAYLKKNPELSAEEEAELPEQFQLPEEPTAEQSPPASDPFRLSFLQL